MTRTTQRLLARDVREGLDDLEHAAVKTGRRVANDARELAAEAVSEGRAIAAQAIGEARRRPALTLAIGATVAAVVGFLMIPRRRRR